ncbi:putative Serpin family protein [Helianthus debilis subsp. tardiflorus]
MKAEEVADEVNSWAKEQTHDLIKEVITAEKVSDDTKLILTNAIYFKGTWSQQFETSLTEEGDFHLLNGNKVKVPFMTNYEKQFVHEYDDFKVLGLPYSQGPDKRKFTMYFYLSDAKDGLPSLIKKIGSTPNLVLGFYISTGFVKFTALLYPNSFKILTCYVFFKFITLLYPNSICYK